MRLALLLLISALPALSQEPAPLDPAPLAPRVMEVLKRSASSHSPTPEEITAVATLPPATDLSSAIPVLMLALESADTPVRTYALTALAGLETPIPPVVAEKADPEAATPKTATAQQIYKPQVATLLAPQIGKIAAHLNEDKASDRLLTAAILGGFLPSPPAAIFAPLFAFLKREDAVGPVGQAVVADLLNYNPISTETADAIARFLRRSDQTLDTRSDLVDAIATNPHQSAVLNKALLGLLTSADPSLRARVILSLPQLDLAPDTFADARSRVQQMADNPNENLQVVSAAKAVAPCWTAVKMTTGCPTY